MTIPSVIGLNRFGDEHNDLGENWWEQRYLTMLESLVVSRGSCEWAAGQAELSLEECLLWSAT